MNDYESMNKVLNDQKEYFIKNGSPSIELRIDRLERLRTLIMDNRNDFVEALKYRLWRQIKKCLNVI